MSYVCAPPSPRTSFAWLLAAGLGLVGCGRGDADGHEGAARIEIETQEEPAELLAVWTPEHGWEDEDGASISELPDPVRGDEGLLPMRAGGDRAALSIRFFEPDGHEVEMETRSQDEDTGERECSEDSARYYPLDDETDVVAWPPIQHPDSPEGSFQFAELAGGDVVGIFRCDAVHIYPETEGTVDVEFTLWHHDHADEVSDPLALRVEPAE